MQAGIRRRNSRRSITTPLLVVIFAGVMSCAAQQPPPDLKAKADAAQGTERIGLSLDYAHHELEHANSLYGEGDVEKAKLPWVR